MFDPSGSGEAYFVGYSCAVSLPRGTMCSYSVGMNFCKKGMKFFNRGGAKMLRPVF